MCLFHEMVARDIATCTKTGVFDPARYTVARVVLARYHIEQYMPKMFGCNGCCSADMTSDIARQEFSSSGLEKPMADILSYRNAHIDGLQQALDMVAVAHDLSVMGLHLPADPLTDDAFMSEAVVDLLEGYTGSDAYAGGPLTLKKSAHKPAFEPLRHAAEGFLNQPGVEPVLKQMMENAIARLFIAANDPSFCSAEETREQYV